MPRKYVPPTEVELSDVRSFAFLGFGRKKTPALKPEDDARQAEYYHKHHAERLHKLATKIHKSGAWEGEMTPHRLANELAIHAHNNSFALGGSQRRINKELSVSPHIHANLAEHAFTNLHNTIGEHRQWKKENGR